MTEQDLEIQNLLRELKLAKLEIERLRKQRDEYLEEIEYQRNVINHLMEVHT